MSDCLMEPCVRNSKGEIVESKLFKGLRSLFDGDRQLAWEHYEIATSQQFLDAYDVDWKFDDNGEINVQQYAPIIQYERPEFPMSRALDESLKPGDYGFIEAIEKVAAFNRRQSTNAPYIAVIRQSDKHSGLFNIRIAPNTEEHRAKTEKVIQGQQLKERLIALLAKHGVSVEFIRGDSRYSTEKAEQTADELYSLIKWKNTGSIEGLAEGAGHFVIGAMGTHPLVERMETLLQDEDTRNAALKSLGVNPDKVDLGSNPAREVASMLVGKAIERKLSHNIFTKLADRIANAFAKLISKISTSDVLKAKAEAKLLAAQFATSFIAGEHEQEGIKEALKISETGWRKAQGEVKKSVSLTLADLEALRRELNATEGSEGELGSKLKNIIRQAGELMPNEKLEVMQPQALLTIVQGMVDILDSTEPDNSEPISEHTPLIELEQHLKTASGRLIKYTLCARKAQDILYLLDHYYDSMIKDRIKGMEGGEVLYQQYLEAKKKLEEHVTNVFDSVSSAYSNEARNIAAAYLSALYGDRFVAYNEGLLWNGSRGKHITFTFGTDPTNTSPNKIDITQYVYEDDGWMQRFLGSLINSKDVGAQLVVRAIKASKRSAEQRMGEAFSELMLLDEKAKKLGIKDYQRFYERNEKGELTGNLRWVYHDPTSNTYRELNWDAYEQEKQKIHMEVYDEFVKSSDFQVYKNASPAVQQVILSDYFDSHPKILQWHHENSEQSVEHNQMIPLASKYGKDSILTEKEIQWYQEYQQTFNKYKSWLGDKKMAIQLAPQTRGSFWNSMKNLKDYRGFAGFRALGRSIKNALSAALSRDHELINEASHYNWNTEEETVLNKYLNAKNNINTRTSRMLPVYHNRKLKDLQRLDTNLIAATMKFAAMAAQYNASNEIKNQLEITVQQLESRSLYETDDEKATTFNPGSQSRKVSRKAKVNDMIREYIDAHFYGLNYGIFTKLHPLTHNKLAQHVAAVGGKVLVGWYLANNVISSVTNVLTGAAEIYKEARIGSHFNRVDWARANAIYALNGIPMILDVLAGANKVTYTPIGIKVNKFNQTFNTLDQSKEYYTEYRTWGERMTKKWLNPLTIAMSGYALTEHYMQSIPYMAQAMHTKLYTLRGTKTDLWKELTETLEQDSVGGKLIRVKNETLEIIDTVFDSKEKLYKYRHVDSLIMSMQKAKEQEIVFSDYIKKLNQERGDEYKYLKEVMQDEGILDSYFQEDTIDFDAFIELLEKRKENLKYNQDNLIAFGQQARECTNRLHGVYNREDKSAFNRTLLGILLLPFKGYAFGMMQKRFGGRHYNIALGRESEGYFNSSAKGLISGARDIATIAYGAFNSLTHSEPEEKAYYSNLAAEAVRHLPYLAASVFTYNEKVLDKAGLNKTQAENFRHTIFATALISAIATFTLYASAMAGGEDEDEEVDALAVYDESGNLDVRASLDNLKAYGRKKGYTQYVNESGFVDPDHESLIGAMDLSGKKINSLGRGLNLETESGVEEFGRNLVEHMQKEFKRLNRQDAFFNRPGWNLANCWSNRMLGEQMAFNSYQGLKQESLGLDLLPLSFKAMYEMYEMIELTSKPASFERSYLAGPPQNASEDTLAEVQGYHSATKWLLEQSNDNSPVTVNEAIQVVQMSSQTIYNKLVQRFGAEAVNQSDATNLQRYLAQQIAISWKRLYPDEKMDQFYYTKSKKGYYPRFTKKSDMMWETKLNPATRLKSVMHNSNQYNRDRFFGRKSK